MLAHLATGREFSFDDHDELTPPVGGHNRVAPILPTNGRLIRSHEPYDPAIGRAYQRVVYLVRDGRDVAVSYYHHFQREGFASGSFADFFGAFLDGSIGARGWPHGWGSWQGHIRSWMDSPQARDGRLLVVRYEDLVEDPAAELARVATFLGIAASPETILATAELHRPERMRERERASAYHARQGDRSITFVRRAAPGEFKEVLSQEQLHNFESVAGVVAASLGYPVGQPARAAKDKQLAGTG